MTRSDEIATIELTPEEVEEAIFEAKKAKYFREKHAPYWNEKERQKPKDNEQKNAAVRKTYSR